MRRGCDRMISSSGTSTNRSVLHAVLRGLHSQVKVYLSTHCVLTQDELENLEELVSERLLVH